MLSIMLRCVYSHPFIKAYTPQGKDDEFKNIEFNISDSKVHSVIMANKSSITLKYEKPHGFFYAPKDFKTITIKLFDPTNGMKEAYSKTYDYNSTDPFVFIDSGKYHMNVTAKLDVSSQVIAHIIDSTKRVLGSTKKLDIEVRENEKYFAILWQTNYTKYRLSLTNTNANPIEVVEYNMSSVFNTSTAQNQSNQFNYM